jgi:tetratricopeptide (TPR) repeat protein
VTHDPVWKTVHPRSKPGSPARIGLLCALVLVLGGAPAARSQEPAPGAAPEASAPAAPVIAQARRLADAKQLGQATTLLRGHLERDPSNREARSLLARLLSWDGRYRESIEEYTALLAEEPESATDRAGYARVLAWSGRVEAALDEFERALAIDSTDVETRAAYARALAWIGDLPGASREYHHILDDHPDNGDAWLGYATLVRWRAGATASERFLAQAEANGADRVATAEERATVQRAIAPGLSAGWNGGQERQYLAGPDFTLRSSGPFTSGRVTIGRRADLTVRAAWIDQYERAENGTIAYDVDMRMLRADVALPRAYPIQAAAGLEARHVAPGAAGVAYPLLDAGNFVGWNARTWGFFGRLTPALGVRREFLPLKATSPASQLLLGRQTVVEGTLAWQWSGRGSAETGLERGGYSDGNARMTVRAGTAYRVRVRQPTLSLDYGFGFTDFDTTSSSYFTPLSSTRHAAGILLDGYAQRLKLGYGARLQLATIGSDNFGAIRTRTVSGHVNAADLGPVGLGINAAYSRDNNDYEIWSIGIHAGARW